MGVIVEKYNDKKGIIWPRAVAPFDLVLININQDPFTAQKVYQQLLDSGVDILWDDREQISVGSKFADAELLGIPYRAVISQKHSDGIELKARAEDTLSVLNLEQVISLIKNT